MEAAIYGIPAIAVSLDTHDLPDFEKAAAYARHITPTVAKKGLPELTLLNVNVPHTEQIKGVKFTRQGRRRYHDELVTRQGPSGRSYYWIGGERPTGDSEVVDTDIWAVANGYISITPIRLDMTATILIGEVSRWGLDSIEGLF
jgi:5'-nucleotidase